MVGAGVRFTKGGESLFGWIVKVLGDMATVLPAHKQVDNPLVLESNETRPWQCQKRGDIAIVHDGPKRNVKGKIVGLQNSTVIIRPMKDDGQPATGAGGAALKVDIKDIVMYSSNPQESVDAHLAAAEKKAAEAAAAEAAAEDGQDNVNWWDRADGGYSWKAGSAVAAKLGDEDTPRSAVQADTPMTAGEATPMVEVSETPPEHEAETPYFQGAAGAFTPMPGGITPMLPAGTPMVGRRTGGVTPMPAQDVRVDTPLDMKKAETPLTPRPGAETPRPMDDVKEQGAPTPMVAGAVTPGGGIPLKKGEDTPMTPGVPGVVTPGDHLKKGEDTPASGSQTPFQAFPAAGEDTPLAPVPGSATPAVPPPVGDSPPLAKDEGPQTPPVSFGSGEVTPQAGRADAADGRRQAKRKAAPARRLE